jgi:(1->4)-alpha-D-glucan 1-alpha-D-glucosylmutase
MNVCNQLLVEPDGLKELTGIYHAFTNEAADFEPLSRNMKLNVERETLGSDVNRLTSLFVEVCENNRDRRDYTRAEIRRALREIASCFTVYRTYVVPSRDQVTDEDRSEIDKAIAQAKLQTGPRSSFDGFHRRRSRLCELAERLNPSSSCASSNSLRR